MHGVDKHHGVLSCTYIDRLIGAEAEGNENACRMTGRRKRWCTDGRVIYGKSLRMVDRLATILEAGENENACRNVNAT